MTEPKPVAWADAATLEHLASAEYMMAVVCSSQLGPNKIPLYTREALTALLDAQADAAYAEAREQAAKVADAYPQRDPGEDGNGYWAAEEIATAIRAMQPEKPQ